MKVKAKTKKFNQICTLRERSDEAFRELLKEKQINNSADKRFRICGCFRSWQRLIEETANTSKANPSTNTLADKQKQTFLEDTERTLRNADSPLSDGIRDLLRKAANYIVSLPPPNNTSFINDNYYLAIKLSFNYLLVEMYYDETAEAEGEYAENILKGLNANIILSRIDYFSEYYSSMLYRFDNMFTPIQNCDAHIFHVIGVLNFRCHNYNNAIEFLARAKTAFENELGADIYNPEKRQNEYFQTCLLLTYCFEYDHYFAEAIELLLGFSVEYLFEIYKNSPLYDVITDPFERDRNHIERVRKFISDKVLENDCKGFLNIAHKRDIEPINKNKKSENETWGDKHEILHNLAHCCNELAIKKINNTTEEDSVKVLPRDLFQMARDIMLLVAEHNHEGCIDFQTCLYMIYGEAKDWDICLKMIEKQFNDKFSKRSISFQMENLFYKYLAIRQAYFNPEKHEKELKEADEAYIKFKKLARLKYDYDSLIYIEIFHFRFEMIKILRYSGTDILNDLKELKSSDTGIDLFGNKPSTKVNKWIRKEYIKTKAIYEFLTAYLESPDAEDIIKIYNYAMRFSSLLKFFERDLPYDIKELFNSIKPNSATDKDEDKLKAINNILDVMIEDFMSPQSIFILAPVSSAIPYQSQSGDLTELEERLWSDERKDLIQDPKTSRFGRLSIPDRNLEIHKSIFKDVGYDNISFIATKHQNVKKYPLYFLIKSKITSGTRGFDISERPIINFKELNTLLDNLLTTIQKKYKPVKEHKYDCLHNGKSPICAKYFRPEDTEVISMLKKMCKELMIADNLCKDKHFIFRYIKDGQTDDSITNWCIIALKKQPTDYQMKKIRNKLCGQKSKEIQVADHDYCFISHSSSDNDLVVNDLLELQDNYKVRFWYDQTIPAGSKWNEDNVFPKMDAAKCLVFYVSKEALEHEGFFQEAKYAIELLKNKPAIKKIIIPIFKDTSALKDAINLLYNVDHAKFTIDGVTYNSHDIYEKLFLEEHDTHVYRMADPDDKSHINDSLIVALKKSGVVNE
jgi:hypothetical protein